MNATPVPCMGSWAPTGAGTSICLQTPRSKLKVHVVEKGQWVSRLREGIAGKVHACLLDHSQHFISLGQHIRLHHWCATNIGVHKLHMHVIRS